MSQREMTPPRTQGYSIASMLLLMSFLAAGMALLRSGVANGVATKDRMLIAALIVCGSGLGAVVGLVIGIVGPNRRLGIPVSLVAGALAGGFCGGVLAVNIWFPLFLLGGVVICIVAGIINLTHRRTGPPPPPQPATGSASVGGFLRKSAPRSLGDPRYTAAEPISVPFLWIGTVYGVDCGAFIVYNLVYWMPSNYREVSDEWSHEYPVY